MIRVYLFVSVRGEVFTGRAEGGRRGRGGEGSGGGEKRFRKTDVLNFEINYIGILTK